SMGTAETLVGTLPERPLERADYEAGLSFGLHVAPQRLFWMGGNSASGGSLEWLRHLLADESLSYEEILSLLARTPEEPTGILYYPYLSGSGAPLPMHAARAAFVGLTGEHNKPEWLRA